MKKTALVLGAGGFIGSHLVKRLKEEKYYVVGADLKQPEFSESLADEFFIADLRNFDAVRNIMREYDEVYQLAADMGGAGYIFTGEHDADVMCNSAQINLNVAHWAAACGVKKLFFSSSACVYPEHNQTDPNNPNCIESSAYPANPDSEYGWEKLFSERLYQAYCRNYGLDVRIARFHNIFGPCFDVETEVLTKSGWKFFKDVNINVDLFATLNDNNELIYIPAKYKQEYHYCGDMYYVDGQSINQLVTPNHNLYVSTRTTIKNSENKWKAGDAPYKLIKVSDLNWNVNVLKFTSFFNWKGDNLPDNYLIKYSDMSDGRRKHKGKYVSMMDWFEFIGWYVTDGSSFKTKSNYTVCITQYELKNSENRNRIKILLRRMDINFSEDKNHTQIIISNKQIYEAVKECGKGAENKKIPDWMLLANSELLSVLFETMMKGDGDKTGHKFSTVSKKLKDQFMEIALKLGKTTTCSITEKPLLDTHHQIYRIFLSNRKEFWSKRNTRRIVKYDGMVYDVTLPEYHILLVRRNGRVCWSGNCGSWNNGKEKAPAAICRKVAEAEDGGEIEIWGDGQQTRSFMFIDECLEGVRRLMDSHVVAEPINIGSDEMISINGLVELVAKIAKKNITIKHIDGPLGVRGRCSNNALIGLRLGWRPSYPLELGLIQTYAWIKEQVDKNKVFNNSELLKISSKNYGADGVGLSSEEIDKL